MQHYFQIKYEGFLANNILRHFSILVLDNNFKLTWIYPTPFSIKWQTFSAACLKTSCFFLKFEGGWKAHFPSAARCATPAFQSISWAEMHHEFTLSLAAHMGEAQQPDGTGWEHSQFNVVAWNYQEVRTACWSQLGNTTSTREGLE